MKKSILLLPIMMLLFLTASHILAQYPIYDSHTQFEPAEHNLTDEGTYYVDQYGNIYNYNYLPSNSFDADPGPGEFILEKELDFTDYIRKFNSNGEFQWAILLRELPSDIVVTNNGTVCLAGDFYTPTYSSYDFNPGPGVSDIVPSDPESSRTPFVVTISSSGQFLKAYRPHEADYYDYDVSSFRETVQSIHVKNGYLYCIGLREEINPSNTYSIVSMSNLNTGNIVWSAEFNSQDAYFQRLKFDDSNVILFGQYSGDVDFDLGPGYYFLNSSSNSTEEEFILKLSWLGGSFQWVKDFKIPGNYYDYAGIEIDNNDNIYIMNTFEGNADFMPGSESYILNGGNRSYYVQKLNASGELVWAKKLNLNDVDIYGGNFILRVDDNANVYVFGEYEVNSWETSLNINHSQDTFIISGEQGMRNRAVLKLDEQGDFIWAYPIYKDFHGLDLDIGLNNEVLLTGQFESDIQLDFLNESALLSGANGERFTVKIIECSGGNITPNTILPELVDECSLNEPLEAPGATNECGYQFTGTNNGVFPITDIGTTEVTWTYKGYFGESSNQAQSFTIDPLDITISMSGLNLTATANGAVSYQWYLCDGDVPVNGAVDQTFYTGTPGNYYVVVYNGECHAQSDCFNMNGPVGISNNQHNNILVYPNPTDDILTIQTAFSNNLVTEINILDLLGNQVIQSKNKGNTAIINTSGLPIGIYYLNIKNGQNSYTQRITVY